MVSIPLLREAIRGLSSQVTMPHRELLAQLFLTHGMFSEARELLAGDDRLRRKEWGYLQTDLLNPFGRSPFRDPEEWWRRFTEFFTSGGFYAPTLTGGGAAPFDRLGVSRIAGAADGPLVTVVMTSFQPEREPLLTSVRSILEQTWQNLEVVLVDDHSSPEYLDVLEEASALDSRIRLRRLPHNGGTYLARNEGIRLANGEFVTGQDADDWSHPQRIEQQIAPLLADGTIAGSRVRSVTTNDDLVINRPGFTATRPNPSTLMFAREAGIRLGGFLPARKAADSEFHARLDAASTRPVVTLGDSPLTVVRIRTNSLSRSDFRLGWSHPSRRAFVDMYRYWHSISPSERLRSREERPAFPLPSRMQVKPSQHRTLDITLVGDFRPRNQRSSALISEAADLARRGLSVGVMHLEDPTYPTGRKDSLAPELLDILHRGVVSRVLEDDAIRTQLVVIRDPALLTLPPGEPFSLEPARVVVIADTPPSSPSLRSARYDTDDISEVIEDLFGVRATWAASNTDLYGMLRTAVQVDELTSAPLPLHVDTRPWEMTRGRFRSSRPVIGRAAPDTPLSWPADAAELQDAYPIDHEYDVRVLGGIRTPEHIVGKDEVRRGWTVFTPSEISQAVFLKSIDFYVDFPHHSTRDLTEATVLEAMAAGCVVVLPPEYGNRYGAAAVYSERGKVRTTIATLYQDPASYRSQSRRAVDFVANHHSGDLAYQSLVSLLEEPGPINSSDDGVRRGD